LEFLLISAAVLAIDTMDFS